MRLAFMGTPEFAVPSLAELIASGHEIVAVWSQPPPGLAGAMMRRSSMACAVPAASPVAAAIENASTAA